MERGETEDQGDLPWSPSAQKTPAPKTKKESEGKELSFSLSPSAKGAGGKLHTSILNLLKTSKDSRVREVSLERTKDNAVWTAGPFSPPKRIPRNSLYLDVDCLVDTPAVRNVLSNLKTTLRIKQGFVIVDDPAIAHCIAIVQATDQNTYYDEDEDESWIDCRFTELEKDMINRTLSVDDGTIFFIALINSRCESHPLPSLRERVFAYRVNFTVQRGYGFLNNAGPRVDMLQRYKPGTRLFCEFGGSATGFSTGSAGGRSNEEEEEDAMGNIQLRLEELGFDIALSFEESSCGVLVVTAEYLRQNKTHLLESSDMFNKNLLYRWFLVVYGASSPKEVGVDLSGLECYFFSLKENQFHEGSTPKPIAEVLTINQQFSLDTNNTLFDNNHFYH